MVGPLSILEINVPWHDHLGNCMPDVGQQSAFSMRRVVNSRKVQQFSATKLQACSAVSTATARAWKPDTWVSSSRPWLITGFSTGERVVWYLCSRISGGRGGGNWKLNCSTVITEFTVCVGKGRYRARFVAVSGVDDPVVLGELLGGETCHYGISL